MSEQQSISGQQELSALQSHAEQNFSPQQNEQEEESHSEDSAEKKVPLQIQNNQQLKTLFQKYDQDGDGKLKHTEVYKLLSQLITDIYKGSVTKICRILSLIENQGIQVALCPINFNSFQQYYQKLKNPADLIIWKQILSLRESVVSNNYTLKGQEIISKNKPQRLNFKVLVGEVEKQKYNNKIYINLQKQIKKKKPKKNQNKVQSSILNTQTPNLQLTLIAQNEEKANIIVQQLNKLIQFLKQFVQGQYSSFQQIFNELKININKQGTIVKLRVESYSKKINELFREYNKFIDLMSRCQNVVNVEIQLDFDCNLAEFAKNAGKTIQSVICNDFKFNFNLKTSDCIGNWKQFLLKMDFFDDLSYDSADPFMLLVIGYFSTEIGDIFLKFKNLGEIADNFDEDFIGEIIGLQMLNEYICMINSEQMPININCILSALKGPINLNVQVFQLNLKLIIDLLQINQFLTKPLARFKDQDQQ